MMSRKLIIRLSFLAGLLSWLLFSFFDIYLLFIERYELKVEYSGILPQIFLTTFIISLFFYFKFLISKADSLTFMDLLWRVFITGLITTIFSLGVKLFFFVFANSAISQSAITITFFYNVLIALVVIFLVSTFVVWKRLILYQKSKNLVKLWAFFEYFLLASMVFDLFGNKMLSTNFNVALIFLAGFSVVLSFNLKWVAYLNFKQKWKSILFILLSCIYIYNFLFTLDQFSATRQLTIDLLDRVLIVSLFIFIIFYAGVSVLVTLFNLPTSSVFEKKIKEAMDIQKLSYIPRGNSTVEETADILLESSMSAVFADAAWIEIRGSEQTLITQSISEKVVGEIKDSIKSESLLKIVRYQTEETSGNMKIYSSLDHPDYKSIMLLPIIVQGKQIGMLALLQEVVDAFNRELVDIIITFVNQASIAIENTELIRDALENERYKEQLHIAKSVQKSLLPAKLAHNEQFDIEAYSVAADEVGGDYYDILEVAKGVFGLVIGDVSGKGTSAAFNMAQMKGIFHSLAYQNCSASSFIIQTNRALSKCLEKSSFITASYFRIDTANKNITYSRAGHCPALYYSAADSLMTSLDGQGLGLGILRNSEYNQYVEEDTITYRPGDLLLLYTDGITEAKNKGEKQYGLQGLEKSLLKHIDRPLEEIKKGLIEDLHQFLNGKKLDDDYTLTIVKFSA